MQIFRIFYRFERQRACKLFNHRSHETRRTLKTDIITYDTPFEKDSLVPFLTDKNLGVSRLLLFFKGRYNVSNSVNELCVFSLQNRVALITGASGGIGSAIVKNFLNQGAKVVVSGTNLEKLSNLIQSFNASDRVAFVVCNLSDPEETNLLFTKAEEKFGPIDILINNAGKTKDKLLIMMKDEDFEEVININLTSTFRLCKAAIKSMSKRQYGRIINITSIVGFTGNAGQANYTAAKAGIVGLSKTLAIEYATKGITINCVAPGFTETPMTDVLSEKIKEAILTKIPMKKMGTPDDIAAACIFLASEEASYMTGQTLHSNGGMAMY